MKRFGSDYLIKHIRGYFNTIKIKLHIKASKFFVNEVNLDRIELKIIRIFKS